MAINKRFAHLNHSGSNHSILDAESAYITGTLQVGPNIPVLGADVNFFVSGAMQGKDALTPGVGVFGGDLVVSGDLYFDGTLYGVIPGSEAYFYSLTNDIVETSGSLYVSQSLRAQFVSSSTGAEVTGSVNVIGSVLVDLTQGPNQTFIISGSFAQSSEPYFKIVDSTITPYDYFIIDSANGPKPGVIISNSDPNVYTRIDPFGAAIGGADLRVVSGSNAVELYSNFIGLNPAIYFTATSSSPTASIVVADDLFAPADLDLTIRALKINNDAGTSGYVLTSQGAGTSPIWAAASGGGVVQWEDGTNRLATTSSVAVAGALGAGYFADNVGSDVFFFVSGATENNSGYKAVFGGTTFVSGNLQVPFQTKIESRNLAGDGYLGIARYIDGGGTNLLLVGDSDGLNNGVAIKGEGVGSGQLAGVLALITGSNAGFFSGSYSFPQGITGSITKLTDGSDYLLAGTGITLTTQSNGAILIDANAVSSGPQWYYSNVDEIATSGSAAITGSLAVTGAAYFSPAGTGRGLLKFGGLDIGPITGSNYVVSADGTGYLSGSILSASNGVFDGTFGATVRHEFHIIATAPDLNGDINSFAATYLVMSSIASSTGIQKVRSVTEVSRETSGSYAANWDVNVTEDGIIELTSSIDSGITNIYWYAQRTKEMSINILGSRS